MFGLIVVLFGGLVLTFDALLQLQVQRPLFVLIIKCGMARVRKELKALDSVILLLPTQDLTSTSVLCAGMLTLSQVHPAIITALLDAVR